MCGSVTLRNVNEMCNARNAQCKKISTLADACSTHFHFMWTTMMAEEEAPSYPEEEEEEGKDDGRKKKK